MESPEKSDLVDDGYKLVSKEVLISANNEGLLSLANHLLTLAQKEVPIGSHIHLDEYNSLEEGSIDLIIEKKETV